MNHYAKLRSIILMLVLMNQTFFSTAQSYGNILKVTDKLYMVSGLGGNVSFLTTNEGVLVVDAGTLPRDGRAIQEHIKNVTDKPIKYIVLTHYHYDHAFGLCGFDKDIMIIAHANTIKNLNKYGSSSKEYFCNHLKQGVDASKISADSLKKTADIRWPKADSIYQSNLADYEQANAIEICIPDSSFSKELEITLGEDTVVLTYPGSTHTDGSILVFFKNQHTLASGDFFFNQLMPYIDYEAGSNTLNWIQQTKLIALKDYRYIIPGHGLLAGGKKISQQGDYLNDLRNMVETLMKNGKKLDEIKTEVKLEKYIQYGFQFMLPEEIEAIYNELKKIN